MSKFPQQSLNITFHIDWRASVGSGVTVMVTPDTNTRYLHLGASPVFKSSNWEGIFLNLDPIISNIWEIFKCSSPFS